MVMVFACLIGLLYIGPIGASTFMIDTRESSVRQELEEPIKAAHISLENGLMDALFDSGHIFFNTYSPLDVEEDPLIRERLPIRAAKRYGAEYLILLEPEAEIGTTYWELYAVEPAEKLGSGEVTTEETYAPQEDALDDIWYGVGNLLAEKVFSRLP